MDLCLELGPTLPTPIAEQNVLGTNAAQSPLRFLLFRFSTELIKKSERGGDSFYPGGRSRITLR